MDTNNRPERLNGKVTTSVETARKNKNKLRELVETAGLTDAEIVNIVMAQSMRPCGVRTLKWWLSATSKRSCSAVLLGQSRLWKKDSDGDEPALRTGYPGPAAPLFTSVVSQKFLHWVHRYAYFQKPKHSLLCDCLLRSLRMD